MLERDTDPIPGSFVPKYELSPPELQILCAELLLRHAYDVSENFRYLAVEVQGDNAYSNIGRHIERVVFEEMFGNTAEQMGEEYGPYEAASNFFILSDRFSGQAIGVLRLIGNSQAGFKSLNDARCEPFNVNLEEAFKEHNINSLDKVFDIGTIAVLPEYRAGLSSVQLYLAMCESSHARSIDHWVSIIDDKALRVLKNYLNVPFVALGGSKPGPYLGSKNSHAVYSCVPRLSEIVNGYTEAAKGRLMKRVFDISSKVSKTILLSLSAR